MRKLFSILFLFILFLSTIESAYCCVNDISVHASKSLHSRLDSKETSNGPAQTETQHHCELNCPCVHHFVGIFVLPVKVVLPQNDIHFSSYSFSYEAPCIGSEPFPPIQA